MLILLPPSEGKTPAPAGNAPVSFADLSFPELTAERESVLEELTAVSSGSEALAELKVGASLEAEVERNTRLLTEPAQPAIRTYTGVLFEALDYASFSPAERDTAHWSLLISSALWGILRPEDAIPAYRLSMGVKLGSIGALANFWKGALGTALEATAKDQLILDCRSSAYAKSWVTPPLQTLAVRVERVAADGSRKVVSHMAKHYRGLFARYLIQSGLTARPLDGSTAGIAEFLEAVSEDWSVECTLPTARKAGVLTLLVHEEQ
ncbi:MAG: peroxide stress protein YaaA [Rothia mucilaginosa]|uniref:YaaA family protein n=1 Tax=Rothia mucilaginosa TaxID=43675 RepID=UPI001DFF7EBC|nr:peroxide stress protein YaaA [Rothia mucilaginosa]MBS6433759.1 peroxide stress protein YaaA [Rothia mucilaginosa]